MSTPPSILEIQEHAKEFGVKILSVTDADAIEIAITFPKDALKRKEDLMEAIGIAPLLVNYSKSYKFEDTDRAMLSLKPKAQAAPKTDAEIKRVEFYKGVLLEFESRRALPDNVEVLMRFLQPANIRDLLRKGDSVTLPKLENALRMYLATKNLQYGKHAMKSASSEGPPKPPGSGGGIGLRKIVGR